MKLIKEILELAKSKHFCPYTNTGLPPFQNKLEPGHEYEWTRVQRERKEGDPKYLGKFFRPFIVQRPTNQEMLYDTRRGL